MTSCTPASPAAASAPSRRVTKNGLLSVETESQSGPTASPAGASSTGSSASGASHAGAARLAGVQAASRSSDSTSPINSHLDVRIIFSSSSIQVGYVGPKGGQQVGVLKVAVHHLLDYSRVASPHPLPLPDSAVEQQRQCDNNAGDDGLEEGGDVEQVEAVVENGDDQRSDERAAEAPFATSETRTTHHNGGNRVELVGFPGGWLRGAQPADEDHAGERRQHAGERVNQRDITVNRDARKARGDRVVADGVNILPDAGAVQDKHGDEERRRKQDNRHRDRADEPRADEAEYLRQAGDRPA